MSNPLVSVLIPNYNKGKFLTEALFSVFAQTYEPIEVILVDDGSTDQSTLIASVFLGIQNFKYERLKGRSGRPSVPFQKALELSTGDYVAFMGSDDVLAPYFIEDLMAEVIKDPTLDFVYSNLVYIDGDRNPVGGILKPGPPGGILDRCCIGLVTSIVRRSILVSIGGFDTNLSFSEDWDIIIKLFKENARAIHVNQTNYLGRRIAEETSLSKAEGSVLPNFSDIRRIESHTYLRKKHNLSGPCRCGCGAPGNEIVVPTGTPPAQKENQTVSVSMIVKNEEAVIEKCLKSIVGLDEIVILDTGSTDKTPEIAKKYTDKFIFGEYSWNDNFAEARNESLKRCTGDWILIIDADEELGEGGISKIRNIIKEVPGTVRAIGFKTIAMNGGLIHDSVRLFRNNIGIVWHGAVHNYLSERAQIFSDISLSYGYSPAHQLDPERSFRILKKEVEKFPNCTRERFYLAREYYYKKDWKEALEQYRKYLEVAYWDPEKAEAWMQVSRCYRATGMIFEARLACLRAIEINPDFRDALNWMADLSVEPYASMWKGYAKLAKNSGTLFRTLSDD